MKQLIGHDIGSYVFNPAARTITLVQVPSVSLDQILTIVNVTSGIMIFCFADPTLGGSESNNIITVNYNTSTMAATDSLQIYIDLPQDGSQQAIQNDNYTHVLLERIADLLEPLATQDAANRQRIAVDSIAAGLTLGTVSTVTTCSTVTTVTNPVPLGNLATMGGVDPRYLFIDTARTAYSEGLRRNLTFS